MAGRRLRYTCDHVCNNRQARPSSPYLARYVHRTTGHESNLVSPQGSRKHTSCSPTTAVEGGPVNAVDNECRKTKVASSGSSTRNEIFRRDVGPTPRRTLHSRRNQRRHLPRASDALPRIAPRRGSRGRSNSATSHPRTAQEKVRQVKGNRQSAGVTLCPRQLPAPTELPRLQTDADLDCSTFFRGTFTSKESPPTISGPRLPRSTRLLQDWQERVHCGDQARMPPPVLFVRSHSWRPFIRGIHKHDAKSPLRPKPILVSTSWPAPDLSHKPPSLQEPNSAAHLSISQPLDFPVMPQLHWRFAFVLTNVGQNSRFDRVHIAKVLAAQAERHVRGEVVTAIVWAREALDLARLLQGGHSPSQPDPPPSKRSE